MVGLTESKLDELSFGRFESDRLVFVDGVFASALSSAGGFVAPDGREGALVHLPKGALHERPVHLLFVATGGSPGQASHPRVRLVADEGSSATLVESYFSLRDADYSTNPRTEVSVGPNASVEHYRLQREAPSASHVAETRASVQRDGRYHSVAVSLGAKVARHRLDALLEGEGAECRLDGFYMVGGEQRVENLTAIDHARPYGTSRELYKGILHGKARAVFNGRIVVRSDAQKTDAWQTNKNLVLSEGAEANSTPQLEIFANDVKCKHGATIGRLDEAAIFYLLSRGIGRAEARSILSHAFADEVIDRMKIEALRKGLDCLLLLSMPSFPVLEEAV